MKRERPEMLEEKLQIQSLKQILHRNHDNHTEYKPEQQVSDSESLKWGYRNLGDHVLDATDLTRYDLARFHKNSDLVAAILAIEFCSHWFLLSSILQARVNRFTLKRQYAKDTLMHPAQG